MQKKWQIVSILLSVVVLVLAFSLLFQQPKTQQIQESLSAEQIVLDNIMTRTSVRSYTDERVSEELVEKMLRAGMAAPTAGNRQPWRFYVIRDTNIIKQMTKVSKYTAPMNESAQLAIVVCGVPNESFPDGPTYWVQDTSAATENILLAAHALGLGAVWCGVFPGEDRVLALRNLIDIPNDLTPLNVIMIGHTDAESNIKDKWKPERISYIN